MITYTSIRSVVSNDFSRAKLKTAIVKSLMTNKSIGITNAHGVVFMIVKVINNKIHAVDINGKNITSILKKGLMK